MWKVPVTTTQLCKSQTKTSALLECQHVLVSPISRSTESRRDQHRASVSDLPINVISEGPTSCFCLRSIDQRNLGGTNIVLPSRSPNQPNQRNLGGTNIVLPSRSPDQRKFGGTNIVLLSSIYRSTESRRDQHRASLPSRYPNQRNLGGTNIVLPSSIYRSTESWRDQHRASVSISRSTESWRDQHRASVSDLSINGISEGPTSCFRLRSPDQRNLGGTNIVLPSRSPDQRNLGGTNIVLLSPISRST